MQLRTGSMRQSASTERGIHVLAQKLVKPVKDEWHQASRRLPSPTLPVSQESSRDRAKRDARTAC